MDNSSTRPNRNRSARMAPLGAILLFLLAAGCDRFMPFSKRYGNPAYYEIVIETPRWRGLYPRTEPIPIRVTIHNGSPKPYVLDFAHDPRRGGCGEYLPVPPWRQPVEVYFTGKTAEGPLSLGLSVDSGAAGAARPTAGRIARRGRHGVRPAPRPARTARRLLRTRLRMGNGQRHRHAVPRAVG